jgi:hypothetical protein
MTIVWERSAWRKQKCYVHFPTSSVKSVPYIVGGTISFVFTTNIEDTWEIPGKNTSLVFGRQNPSLNSKFLCRYRTVPNGSLSMNLWKGKGNDTQF